MDLYIQIGVIFLMLAAFSTFAYFYTEPVEMFSSNISESSAEINLTLDKIQNRYLEEFNNNPAVPGTSVETLVKQSAEKGIAVLLQTKNQNTIVVNYGYQLRSDSDTNAKMSTTVTSSPGQPPTDFESSYATGMSVLFGVANSMLSPTTYNIGSAGFMNPETHTNSDMWNALAVNSHNLNEYPRGSELATKHTYGASAYPNGPRLMLHQPLKKVSETKTNGENYYNSGVMYTDQVTKTNMPANTNFSFLDSPTSVYYLDRNASYYSTIVFDKNNEIIGVYIEEHGSNVISNLLARAMVKSGLIKAIY